MKNRYIKIAFKSICVLLVLAIIILAFPENSSLFKQKPVENQQQLGNEIIATFRSKYTSSDTIFIVTERFYNLDCGTGIKISLLDDIRYKYYKLTHRNVIYQDNIFPTPLERTDKIVLTRIGTYTNEQIPNDSDYMVVNGKTITGLKSSKIKIFILNFDSISSNKVEVTFTDYSKNSTAFHFFFVLENKKWKYN